MRRLVALCLLAGAVWLAARSPQARFAWWLATAAPPPRCVVPVEGVHAKALRSSFGAPRSGGREHRGVDILAPRGTPVLAAARGVVVSTRPNTLGGTVVWVAGAGRRLYYYYAHLDRLAPHIELGRTVEAGRRSARSVAPGMPAAGPSTSTSESTPTPGRSLRIRFSAM